MKQNMIEMTFLLEYTVMRMESLHGYGLELKELSFFVLRGWEVRVGCGGGGGG